MAVKALVTVAGVDLPTPSKYIGTTADVVDSARNVEAVVVGSVVREDLGKVEMTFRSLTAKQWSDILKLFNSKHGGTFFQTVEFFNQVTADWETRTMYPGDRTTGGAFKIDKSTGGVAVWENAVLHLVEQ